MRRNKITFRQYLPIGIELAWEFFSSPKNLAIITPKRMNFEILFVSGGNKIHVGQTMGYNVTILPFVRVYWETIITDVSKYISFTDVQKKGPYSFWSHRHSFVPSGKGVEMTDEVEYEIPLHPLGVIANRLFVQRELKNIFEYRSIVLKDHFKEQE